MADDAVTLELRGDGGPLDKALKESEGSIASFASYAKTAMIAIGAAVVVDKVFEYGKAFVSSAAEIEEQETRLGAMIKATGGAAGVTSDQLKEMASRIEETTRFTDDSARAAETALLKFQNIKGDQFEKTMFAAADLAEVLGTDMSSSAQMLGRALEDPERGMMVLRRAGITLSAEQKEQVKQFMELGKVAEAQDIILGEVAKSVGGTAAEMNKTFAGRMAGISKTLENIGEEIGMALLPAVEELLPIAEMIGDGLLEVGVWFAEMLKPIAAGVREFMELAKTAGAFLLEALRPAFDWLSSTAASVASSLVDWLTPAITSVIDAVVQWSETIWGYIKPALDWLVDAAVVAFTAVQVACENWRDLLVADLLIIELAFVKSWNVIVYWLTEVVPEYLAWFGRNWRQVFTDLANFTSTVVTNMFSNLVNFFKSVWSWLKGDGFDFTWTGLTEGFEKTMEDLPKIAERKKGDLEVGLENELADVTGRLSSAFDKQLEANRAKLSGATTAVKQHLSDSADKATKEAAAEEKKLEKGKYGKGTEYELTKEAKGEKASFEDLMSLSKRVTAAAAGPKSDVAGAVKATGQQQVNKMEEMRKEQAKTNEHLAGLKTTDSGGLAPG